MSSLLRYRPIQQIVSKSNTLAVTGRKLMPMTEQVRFLTQDGHGNYSNFSWKGMKKHYAVMPLVGIVATAVTGILGFVFYVSQTRDNVIYNKTTLSESMDLLNPQVLKIKTFNQKYEPVPEVVALYKEMEESENAAKLSSIKQK